MKTDTQNWICIKCGSMHTKTNIFCKSCKIFRPYHDISHKDVDDPSEYEIYYLEQRRSHEKQLILKLEMEEKESSPSAKSSWYIISQKWLVSWKNFIANKQSEIHDSNNSIEEQKVNSDDERSQELRRRLGVIPPACIDNTDLFVNKTIKDNLKISKDYKCVNQRVWQLLNRIYGLKHG